MLLPANAIVWPVMATRWPRERVHALIDNLRVLGSKVPQPSRSPATAAAERVPPPGCLLLLNKTDTPSIQCLRLKKVLVKVYQDVV
jgi:hypothetical protein